MKKGIPDAILTGSALSDVLLLLLFSLLLSFLSGSSADVSLPGGLSLSPLQLLPLQVLLQISVGIALGYVTAKALVLVLRGQRWAQNNIQRTLVAAGLALSLVVVAEWLPVFSGYLAVMAAGFFLIELDMPLARQLRGGFNGLWVVAEIVLFVLLGASIQLTVLESALLPGLLLLGIGTLLGRSLGWYLSTLGSNWTVKERLFLLPGNSAKATVQAAIGAIPLAQGVEGGEVILAIAALSILVTAPLGAWAIPTFAPKLLQRGDVDPTKVAIAPKTTILAAINTPSAANSILKKAAELARQSDGIVIVLHVMSPDLPQPDLQQLRTQTKQVLADIRHQFIATSGAVTTDILQAAEDYNATEIIVGKRENSPKPVGAIARSIITDSPRPVIVVN